MVVQFEADGVANAAVLLRHVLVCSHFNDGVQLQATSSLSEQPGSHPPELQAILMACGQPF